MGLSALAWVIAGLAIAHEVRGADVGTAFTFQGVLRSGGAPAEDPHDMKFRLYDTDTGDNVIGPELVYDGALNPRIDPANGLFTVKLDFGAGVYTGTALWLEMDVSPAGAGTYVTLAPRKEVTATPYAVHALGGAHWQQDGTDIFYDGGKVGIGTGSEILSTFQVAGAIRNSRGDGTEPTQYTQMFTSSNGNFFTASSRESNRKRLFFRNLHDGTGGPSGQFDMTFQIGSLASPVTAFRVLENGTLTIRSDTTTDEQLAVNGKVRVYNAAENKSLQTWVGTSGAVIDAENAHLHLRVSGSDRIYVHNSSGDVGIGTGNTTPGARLDVLGNAGKPVIRAWAATNDDVALEARGAITATGPITASGAIAAVGAIHTTEGIIATGPIRTADEIIATGPITTDAEITGRELVLTGGADIAEPFNVNGEAPAPGTVVVIDPARPGELVASSTAYDRKVVGVVSGAGGVNPGLRLGQKGSIADGEHPVALTGRVYVWCDASFGAITPGDLLTTSATHGHAMNAADHSRAQGAVLGKAMTGLSEGKGLVLVLVTLQ